MNRVPLRYVASLNRQVLPETTDPDLTFLYVDISAVDSTGRVALPDELMTFAAAPSRARRVAPAGATAISTVRTYLRAIACVPASPVPLVLSTGFAVAEAASGYDPRFLYYACRSDPFVDEVVARSVGVSYPAINPGDLAAIPIPSPTIEAQRRIVDFLDDQVARIENIIAVRRAQVLALGSLAIARADEILAVTDAPIRRLGSLLALGAVGVVVNPSSYFVEEGVPFVHGYNVRDGFLDLSDLKRMTAADSAALSRSQLRAGDVLVVRAGYPGRAAVVPQELAGGNCASVLLLRPAPTLEPDWLEAFFNSVVGKRQVELVQYGAAQGVINLGDVRDFEIPLPSVAIQRVLLHQLRESRSSLRIASDLLRNAEARMEELKRSLITAAVTGEFDVSTANGSRVSA